MLGAAVFSTLEVRSAIGHLIRLAVGSCTAGWQLGIALPSLQRLGISSFPSPEQTGSIDLFQPVAYSFPEVHELPFFEFLSTVLKSRRMADSS